MAVMQKNSINRRRIKRESVFKPWERMIALIDLNTFFASIEKLDYPELRDYPVGITNGLLSTSIISSCFVAQEHGIQIGTKVIAAKHRCSEFVQRPARPERYVQFTRKIIRALKVITPNIELHSTHEIFLDVTDVQTVYGSVEKLIQNIKQVMHTATGGLSYSIGVSGDKTTAKYAAKRKGFNSVSIIHPEQAGSALSQVLISDICGIHTSMVRQLQARGLVNCGLLQKLPSSEVQRWGSQGRRVWLASQGMDPSSVESDISDPKQFGHGKMLPPGTCDQTSLQIFSSHMAHQVAKRLRKNNLRAKTYSIGLRASDGVNKFWIGGQFELIETNDGWTNEVITHIHMTALDPKPLGGQIDMFFSSSEEEAHSEHADLVMTALTDSVNVADTIDVHLVKNSPARFSNVVAPSWQALIPRDYARA